MKKMLPLIAISLLVTTAPAFTSYYEAAAATEDTVTIQRDVVVGVDGMVCDFCAQSIKKVFGKQEAVENVDVDLDNGEIVIDLKDGQTLDDATIKKLVVDSGYTIREIEHAK